MYSSVDLPHPDGPRIETNAPSSMVSEISDSARWLRRPDVSNIWDTRSISIIATGCACPDDGSVCTPGRNGTTLIRIISPQSAHRSNAFAGLYPVRDPSIAGNAIALSLNFMGRT